VLANELVQVNLSTKKSIFVFDFLVFFIIGEQIAKIQLFVVLVSLFQKFEFHFADGWKPKDLRGQPGITLRPPDCQYQAFVR